MLNRNYIFPEDSVNKENYQKYLENTYANWLIGDPNIALGTISLSRVFTELGYKFIVFLSFGILEEYCDEPHSVLILTYDNFEDIMEFITEKYSRIMKLGARTFIATKDTMIEFNYSDFDLVDFEPFNLDKYELHVLRKTILEVCLLKGIE